MTFPGSKSISHMSFVPFKAIDYPMAKLYFSKFNKSVSICVINGFHIYMQLKIKYVLTIF